MLMSSIVALSLGLSLTHATEEGSGLADDTEPAPLPECYVTDVPKFINTLKKHIKIESPKKAGELDCSGQQGFVLEICKYNFNFASGDTDVVIKWNDCGKISFICSIFNREGVVYEPTLPEEVTNLGLNGDCPADNTYYIIGGVVGGVVALILAVVGVVICKKK